MREHGSLIEAKLGTCAANVRYSGDYRKMREFLQTHLVFGTDRNVGVQQLLRAIKSVATADKSDLPPRFTGVRKLIPLIITRDDIGSSWMTNGYLNARFQQQRNAKGWMPYIVTPLVSMSVGSLERGLSALQTTSLSDILQQRIKSDDRMSKPFEAASTYISRGTRHTLKHLDMLTILIKEMTEEFQMEDTTDCEPASD